MQPRKKLSLSKVSEKPMSLTMNDKFYLKEEKLTFKQQKQGPQRLPPIPRKGRNISARTIDPEPLRKEAELEKKERKPREENEFSRKEAELQKKEKPPREENETLRKETELQKKERKPLREENELLRKELEPLRKETEPLRKETEPLRKETESLKKELKPLKNDLEPPREETESLRKETETTLSESSMMFQSMYGKEWLRPSDYAREIGELNLLGEEKATEVKAYDINLTEKFEKNIEKYSRMKDVTEKWVQVLKKALSYLHSQKAASDKLIEEIRFWKLLSRKFDELEYEFNDERSTTLLAIMRKFLRTEPRFKPILEEFLYLKKEIIRLTPSVKKLYLQLQEVVSGFIVRLEQCSDICESIDLLRKILIGFEAIGQENELIRNRYPVIYEKMDQCMTQKLLATSLYPRQLANISSVKENYQIIDRALSFYSHFIGSLEDYQNQEQLVAKGEYARQVLANLLQILSYFEHLYSAREVNEFSKLFSHPLDYNIYDQEYSGEWAAYMELVSRSMHSHNFDL